MEKTPFAGLTVLEPGEGLDSDNGAFIDRDRLTIDHFLQLGAKLHRHNAALGLSNPTQAGSASVIASGGAIGPDVSVSVGYTLVDAQGGETMLSPLAVVSTGPPMDVPIAAPSAAFDSTAGSLLVDTYYYALTWTDAEGGETPAGPAVSAERPPGFASGRIKLTNLNYGMTAAGAVGWRLYRAIGGGSYDLLTTGNTAQSAFTDDGTTEADCDTHPPENENTTRHANTLKVILPNADANMSRATAINLYGSLSGDFGEAASLGQFPLASAGHSTIFRTLEFSDAAPPDVNLSVGGASLIDPDTELLDWHWKRPVAASGLLGSGLLGDVKLVENTAQFFAVLSPSASAAGPQEWVPIGSAGSVSASGAGGSVASISKLTLRGSGGATVTLDEPSGREARYTITAPSLTASAASANPGSVAAVEKLTVVPSAGIQIKMQQDAAGQARLIFSASGATGPPGASGSPGAKGEPGAGNLTFTNDGSTSVGTTAEKQIRVDNAKLASVTQIAVSTKDVNGRTAINTFLKHLAPNNYVWLGDSANNWSLFRIISRTTETESSAKLLHVELVEAGSELLAEGLVQFTVVTTSPTDWGLVTALPVFRSVGDTCKYYADKTNGVIWDLIYDGEGEFPWKKIGGPPLVAEVQTFQKTTSKTFAALATAGPSITTPLKGDYDISVEACCSLPSYDEGVMSYDIGATGASDEDAASFAHDNVTAGVASTNSARRRKTGIGSGVAIVSKYHVVVGVEANFGRRRIAIDPIRVG